MAARCFLLITQENLVDFPGNPGEATYHMQADHSPDDPQEGKYINISEKTNKPAAEIFVLKPPELVKGRSKQKFQGGSEESNGDAPYYSIEREFYQQIIHKPFPCGIRYEEPFCKCRKAAFSLLFLFHRDGSTQENPGKLDIQPPESPDHQKGSNKNEKTCYNDQESDR